MEVDIAGIDRHQNQRQRNHDVRAAPQRMHQQYRKRRGNHHARKEHHSLEPGNTMQKRENNFGQPLEGVPFLSWFGERQEIMGWHAAMRKDMIANPDVRSHVPVHQKAVPSVRAGRERPQDHRHKEYVGKRRDEKSVPAAQRGSIHQGQRLCRHRLNSVIDTFGRCLYDRQATCGVSPFGLPPPFRAVLPPIPL